MTNETTAAVATQEQRAPFARVVRPGADPDGGVWVEIRWNGDRLSLSGVEGPKRNGDCRGGCGQIKDALEHLELLADGWTAEMVAELAQVWGRWHLNDLRAGCEHQRAAGWTWDVQPGGTRGAAPCPVCGYKYGTAWLREDVPGEVLDFLAGLPDADRAYPWQDSFDRSNP